MCIRDSIKAMKGFQQVTLEGQALSTLMNQHAKTRRWEGKPRSEVVREVAKEAGWEGAFVDIDAAYKDRSHVSHSGQLQPYPPGVKVKMPKVMVFIDGTWLYRNTFKLAESAGKPEYRIHFGKDIFLLLGETWEPFTRATLIGLAFWLVCLYLYRKKIFLRI